jgi:hypothetical protein
MGYGLDDRGFETGQELGIFLFTTVSRPALEPIQPPTRGSFPGNKTTAAWSWPLITIYCRGQKCVELYLHSPMRLHSWRGAKLKKKAHRVQNGSGSHAASYPIGTRGSFPGVRRPGREADHSPPSSAGVNNAWSYTTIPIRLRGLVFS